MASQAILSSIAPSRRTYGLITGIDYGGDVPRQRTHMTLLDAITHLRTRCLAKADEFAELDALVSGAKTYSAFAAELDRLRRTVQLDTAQMPPSTSSNDAVRSLPAEAVRRRQRQQHLRREITRKRISGTTSSDAIQEIARPATDRYDPDADARLVADLRAKGGKQ